MNYVMIENNGEIDHRLIELMGASTKDGESTIGMFGTGWKYGIALAMRKNIPITLFSGNKKIDFFTKEEHIGGTVFHRICYSVGRSTTKKTSLTTTMGQKDWTDEWFLLREVVSNAVDCGGFSITRTDDLSLAGAAGKTRVFIGLSDRLEEVITNMPQYIRRTGELEASTFGKIFPPISDKCRVYKKGILIKELDCPGIFDYELNSLTLSESRTSDTWNIFWEMRRLLSSAAKENLRKVIRGLSDADSDGRKIAEASVVFSSYDKERDSSWRDAFKEEFGEDGVLCAKSEVITSSVTSMGKKAVSLPEAVATALRGVGGVDTDTALLGAGISSGFLFREETEYEGIVLSKTSDILKKLFGELSNKTKLKIFKESDASSGVSARIFREDDGSYSLAIREDHVSSGLKGVLILALSEIISNLSGAGKITGKDRDDIPRVFVESVLPAFGVVV
jgi:hypothetical protein